jgi:hypothetical protein
MNDPLAIPRAIYPQISQIGADSLDQSKTPVGLQQFPSLKSV